MRTIEDVCNRLRVEFMAAPGLQLTPEQVQPLCGVERTIGQMVLDLLVREQFLRVTLDGHYTHIATGHRANRLNGHRLDEPWKSR